MRRLLLQNIHEIWKSNSFIYTGRNMLASTSGDVTSNVREDVTGNPVVSGNPVVDIPLEDNDELTIDQSKEVLKPEPDLSKRSQKRLKRWLLKKQKSSSQPEKKRSPAADNAECAKQADVIEEETLKETSYYFENGLRKVYPYRYQFMAHAKGRWFGQKLVDVFLNEFQHFTRDSCKRAIESLAVTVNGKPTSVDYILKNGDFIMNAVHRHELPVTAEPIDIISNTDELLVVNKPSSIPIHPCGRYRHNSVLYILAKEKGFRNLRSIYRLDRLTSGVVIFCKTEAKTRDMMELIKRREVEKEYICQVDGEFPLGPIECDQPIDALSHKLGIYRVCSDGKPSKTVFERMNFNGQTSIVKCKPITGRTHQIRVHLQFLGFPITNDPIYNGSVWGSRHGAGGDFGKSDEQLLVELEERHSFTYHLETDTDAENLGSAEVAVDTSDVPVVDVNLPSKRLKLDTDESLHSLTSYDSSKGSFDPSCRECQLKFRDPEPSQLIMFLHAYCYKGPGFCYSTPLPHWADADNRLK